MTTKIIQCTCHHKFQDNRYGLKQRVHNEMKQDGKGKYRCTVCGNVKN